MRSRGVAQARPAQDLPAEHELLIICARSDFSRSATDCGRNAQCRCGPGAEFPACKKGSSLATGSNFNYEGNSAGTLTIVNPVEQSRH